MATASSTVGNQLRRAKSTGTIYQRNTDMRWCAAVSRGTFNGKRIREVRTSKTREGALAILEQMEKPEPKAVTPGRTFNITAARLLGTHTKRESDVLWRSHGNCRYCDVRLDTSNRALDHVIPVARGGSDAVDNLEWICWECNASKSDSLHYVCEVEREYRVRPRLEEPFVFTEQHKRWGLARLNGERWAFNVDRFGRPIV